MIGIRLFRKKDKSKSSTHTTIHVQGQETSGVPASFVSQVRAWINEVADRINALWDNARSLFLSKVNDDTAEGHITLHKGFTASADSVVNGNLLANGLDVQTVAIIRGDTTFSEDGTFAEGLTGHGGRICPDGSAELDSLTLRRFLEVPELRFNRVSVQVENQWRAPGGGIIRSVSPASDATGTALLHLEAGEIGTVAVGDLCMGIFHSETAADNAEANSDDNHGNFRFAGFYTAYWEITAVEDYTDGETGQTFHNGKVSYRLRPVSANYPRQMHPTAAMHFVCYGNRTDAARQSSRYSTLTYERFLTGVSDWEFSSKQIRMQVGDLSAFSPVPGMDFSGYSVYANSIYLDGHLKQLAEMGDPNPYTYSVDNLADTLALDAKGRPKQPVVSTLADGSKSWLLHTSIQVRRGQTLLTCLEDASVSPATGQYRLLCLPVGCTAHFDHSTLYIDSVEYSSRPTAYVEVTIDCEGRAALTYVFTIKVIADGDRGEQGRDGTAYGTRRRYALSARATTASPHTPPDDVATWQDVPLATTEARPYLWIELTDWQQQAGGLQTFSPLSSYVRLTGDRGQRGEDGLDGKDGKSWTLRGTAFGHVTNMASLPSPAPDGIFLVDTGAEGLPVAVRQMSGAWASITTQQGDAYILSGDVWMATETAWANLGRIQGEKGDRGQAGANGRTSRIYQRLDEGQHYYDGSTITADGFCYLDFYAVPSDTAKSGWDVYRCVQSYVYQAAQHALPPADTDHWRSVGVNADSAFFSFLIARDARIDFLQGNAIAIRKKHATAPYAGMGGDFPFWAGAAQPYPDGSGFNGSTYTFAVDETGNLFASSAYLTGTIHATSGSIGGFAIQDGGLTNADDARNGVTITPKSITAQSSRSEDGRVVFDTQSNIVGAIGASSGEDIFWPVALQLTGHPNDFYPGTALDIIEGITRGHRPEPVLIDGSVQLVDTSDAYNVPHPLPQGSPTYSNGQRVYVRSGAVLVNIAAATVALPKNPQHGDCYLFLPCGSYNLTIDPGAQPLTIDGTTFKNKTYTCAKRMVYLVFVGRGASPFGWVGKTLQ